jgi:exopolyphosphatase/guanosine-5'-triphosphate,3'-diphosphate pyrophosphatase
VTRVAVIDIGTNSTRLLVADVDGEHLSEVERLLEITRLGDRVDERGELADDAIERVERAVAGYAKRASELATARPLAVATSAVRDASNGREFLERLESATGVRTRLLTGQDEARMTLRGVGSARPGSEPVVVCDIGGGSTELIAGHGDEVTFEISLDMGCVRMSERYLRSDPPLAEEIDALRAQVRSMLPAGIPAGTPIGVAGTVTTLATIDLGLDEEIPELIDGHRLTAEAVERELVRLAGMPLAERRSARGLMPERAPTIVAGAAILAEVLPHLGAGAIVVSERDILHGAALTASELT